MRCKKPYLARDKWVKEGREMNFEIKVGAESVRARHTPLFDFCFSHISFDARLGLDMKLD